MTVTPPIPCRDLGTDRALRQRLFTAESFAHPAKAHLGFVQHLIDRYTAPGQTILDPMAGIGSTALALLSQRNVILREVEPSFLAQAHRNVAYLIDAAGMFAGHATVGYGDAMQPWTDCADVVLCSPPYGCSVAASARGGKGMTSTQIRTRLARLDRYDPAWDRLVHALDSATTGHGVKGAHLMHYGSHPAQIGHWRGARYWQAMRVIYGHAHTALPAGGVMILILKDHIRDGQRVCTVATTIALCEQLGFRLVDRVQRRAFPLSLWQRRRKERGEPIVAEEDALILEVTP